MTFEGVASGDRLETSVSERNMFTPRLPTSFRDRGHDWRTRKLMFLSEKATRKEQRKPIQRIFMRDVFAFFPYFLYLPYFLRC